MTVPTSRRELLAGGAAFAVSAVMPPTAVRGRQSGQTPESAGPGLVDLQVDLEKALERHRVVGADGTMTGFSGGDGVETKQALLRLEGALLL